MKLDKFLKTKFAVVVSFFGVLLAAGCAQKVDPVQFVEAGKILMSQGEVSKAAIEFDKALALDPSNIEALTGLSDVASARQDFDKLYGTTKQLLDIAPNNVDALVKFGQLELAEKKYNSAISFAEKVLQIEPQNPRAFALIAAAKLSQVNGPEAVWFANKALKIDPANRDAVTVLITERMHQNDFEEALAIVDGVLSIEPDDTSLLVSKIGILERLERHDQVDEQFEKILEVSADNPMFRRMYIERLIQQSDIDGARQQFHKIAVLEDFSETSVIEFAMFEKAFAGVAAGQRKFEDYIALRPDDQSLKFAMAAYLRLDGLTNRAHEIYKSAAAQQNQKWRKRAEIEIAEMAMEAGEVERSHELLEQILKADPRQAKAQFVIATLLYSEADYRSANRHLNLALDINPAYSQARVLLALSHAALGDAVLARRQFETTLQQTNDNPEIVLAYSQFLLANGNALDAERLIEGAFLRHPNNIEIVNALAGMKLLRSDWDIAEALSQRILNVDEENREARNILAAAMIGQGKYEDAEKLLAEDLANSSNTEVASDLILRNMVTLHMKMDNITAAKSLLEANMVNGNASYAANVLMSGIYRLENDFDNAVTVLQNAISHSSKRFDAYHDLSSLLIYLNKPEEAMRVIEQGIGAAITTAPLKLLKAKLKIRNGDRRGAYQEFKELVASGQADLVAQNNYLSLATEIEQEVSLLELAISRVPGLKRELNPHFQDTLGWAYVRAGKPQEAVPYLKEAIRLDQTLTIAYFHLGTAFEALEIFPSAVENYQIVVAREKTSEIGRKAAARLQEISTDKLR